MTVNWDTQTADKCKLPEIMPDACNDCRDYAYCYRQLTLEDMERRTNDETGSH